MSDLLNSASLVLIPSGYKEDVVYSAVPTDGSGDLSFTRASNGTRVNSAGLVEVVPWNLNDNSQSFAGAGWGTDGTSTASDNFTTAPNGTMTAAKVVANVASGYAYKGITLTEGVYTFSLYIKASASTTISVNFDTATSNHIITTEWQRFEISCNVASGTKYMVYAGLNTGVNYFVWGAQLNIGATAKPYFPTTDRLNVPRLTYQNGGGGCPSLLLEKQSTNYARNNNDLTGWTKITGTDTISLNAGTSPDGTSNGINLIPSTANGTHMFYDGSTSVSSSGNFTMTCYAKANGYSKFSMRESASVGYYASFNLSNGTVLDNGGNTASIENLGNGWYRCICSVVASTNVQIGLLVLSDSYTSGQPFGLTWSGDGTKGILTYGAQLEVSSSYATSPISTAGVASATRVADACFKTGISSLIGQTEGTILLDWKQNAFNNSQGIYANNYNLTGSISIQVGTNGTLNAYVCYAGIFIVMSTSSNTIQVGQRYKIGLAYKSGDCALYLNGNLIGTNTTSFAFTTTLSEIDLSNSTVFFANLSEISVNELVQIKTRISNADIQSWTS
jgi:hypothetical protein